MGMDLSYQAIPHASPALERARRDAAFCSELEFWSMMARPDAQFDAMAQRARACDEEHDRAFVDALDMARQAAREHPGIESRRYSPGRSYDALHYLLSPTRRAGEWRHGSDWASAAIFGYEILNASGVTTIGFAIRYNPPEMVRDHAELVGAATRDDLAEHFDEARMKHSGVYKYLGQPDAFEEWMWPEFEEWRDFLLLMLGFPDEGLLCSVG